MSKRYNTISINKFDGRTYWHKSFDTIEKAKAHCHRYVHTYCDIIVYDISGTTIEFVDIWKDFNKEEYRT